MRKEIDSYLNTFKSVILGITSPADDKLREIVDTQASRSECAKYNPPPEDVLPEIANVLNSRQNIKLSRLKSDLGIARSDVMTLFAGFTDNHNIDRVNVFLPYAKGSVLLINEIESVFKRKPSPLGISEQLETSLDLSANNISLAVIYLSLATRMAARNLDSRILGVKLTDDAVFSWKQMVAPFGYEEKKFEDTAGDTYHFWFGVLTGISREEMFDSCLVNRPKQLVCDLTYPYAAKFSEIFRHNLYLGMRTWNVHETVDKVGYEVGRALADMYVAQSH